MLKLKEVMSEGWWDNMSDAAKKAYIKKHGSAPNVAGDDDEKEPSADPGSTWDKHSTKVKATSPEHQKEIDAWMKKYSNPKGGVDWDKAKKDNAPFPKGEPDDPSRSRGRDDVPKEPLARGTKVTASWKGLSGEEQEIPDGQIEDVKYSDSGHEVSYVIRWNNGNNLIELPADKVKGEDEEDDYDMGEVPGSRGTGPWTPEDDPDFEHGPTLTSAPGRVPDEEDEESSGRTGKELDQETLTIDGKQYRRISEGVEKQPKPKYTFSEFYERFKK